MGFVEDLMKEEEERRKKREAERALLLGPSTPTPAANMNFEAMMQQLRQDEAKPKGDFWKTLGKNLVPTDKDVTAIGQGLIGGAALAGQVAVSPVAPMMPKTVVPSFDPDAVGSNPYDTFIKRLIPKWEVVDKSPARMVGETALEFGKERAKEYALGRVIPGAQPEYEDPNKGFVQALKNHPYQVAGDVLALKQLGGAKVFPRTLKGPDPILLKEAEAAVTAAKGKIGKGPITRASIDPREAGLGGAVKEVPIVGRIFPESNTPELAPPSPQTGINSTSLDESLKIGTRFAQDGSYYPKKSPGDWPAGSSSGIDPIMAESGFKGLSRFADALQNYQKVSEGFPKKVPKARSVLDIVWTEPTAKLWHAASNKGAQFLPNNVKRYFSEWGEMAGDDEWKQLIEITLGRINYGEAKGLQIASELQKFSDPKYRRILYNYVNEHGERIMKAPPTAKLSSQDEAIRSYLNTVSDYAARSVDLGKLGEQKFFTNLFTYMTRLTKDHLPFDATGVQDALFDLGVGHYSRMTAKGHRFMQKTGAGEEYIDVPVQSAVGIGTLSRDVELLDAMRQIAGNEKWAMNKAQSGVYERMIRDGKSQYTTVADAGGQSLPAIKYDGDVWVQLRGQGYGDLNGRFVKRGVFDELSSSKLLGRESTDLGKRLMGMYKIGQVAVSPKSIFRNWIGNIILNDMGGLPPSRPDIYAKGLMALRESTPEYKLALQGDVIGHTFTDAEILPVLQQFQKSGGSALSRGFDAAEKFAGDASKFYGFLEDWGKMSKFLHNLEKGMQPFEAAQDAKKWLFDYSRVSQTVDAVRKSPVGIPFVTFAVKAAPRVAEAIGERPWVLAKYQTLMGEVDRYAVQQAQMSEQQGEKQRGWFPGYLKRESAFRIDVKDQYDNPIVLDLTYAMPWGGYTEDARGMSKVIEDVTGVYVPPSLVPSHPFMQGLAAFLTNKDPFTERPLYGENDPRSEKASKVGGYVASLALPALARDAWKFLEQRPGEKYGEPRGSVMDAANRILGLGITPVNLQRQKLSAALEMRRRQRSLRSSFYGTEADKSLSPEDKAEKFRYYRQLIDSLFADPQNFVR